MSQIKIFYNNNKLPVDNSVRFLGVIFSSSFKFNKYIDCLTDRTLKATNLLKSLTGSLWGAHPKILLIFYKSIVRSHFEYGFLCYSDNKNVVDKLDKIQNKCFYYSWCNEAHSNYFHASGI